MIFIICRFSSSEGGGDGERRERLIDGVFSLFRALFERMLLMSAWNAGRGYSPGAII